MSEVEIRDAVETIRFALATGQFPDRLLPQLKQLLGFCEKCQGAGKLWRSIGNELAVPRAECPDCKGKGFTEESK